jgi:hypothetical protein
MNLRSRVFLATVTVSISLISCGSNPDNISVPGSSPNDTSNPPPTPSPQQPAKVAAALGRPTANGHYTIKGNWSDLKHGNNTLILQVSDASGASVSGATVGIGYDMVEMPMNAPDRPVVEKQNGQYEKSIFTGMKGDWQFDITVTKNGIEDTLTKIHNISK